MPEQEAFDIKKWVDEIVLGPAGFRSFEEHEVVVFDNRDCGLADFVLRCLANPRCEGADKVLAEIARRREDVEFLRRVDSDRAQTAAEAPGIGPTIPPYTPSSEPLSPEFVGTVEDWRRDMAASPGDFRQAYQQLPAPSRFGARLRELVVGETGFRHLDTQAGAVLVDLADAIDADAENLESELPCQWCGSRRPNCECPDRITGLKLQLRAKVEATVERLRRPVRSGYQGNGPQLAKQWDLMSCEDFLAALADIFGEAPAGDDELCCRVCGRPNALHGINCETMLDDGEAARQTREELADRVQEMDERGGR